MRCWAENLKNKTVDRPDIYGKLIKGYTDSNGTFCNRPAPQSLSAPARLTFDNNYFNDCYQGFHRGYNVISWKHMLRYVAEWRIFANREELESSQEKWSLQGLKFDYKWVNTAAFVLNTKSWMMKKIIKEMPSQLQFRNSTFRTIEHKTLSMVTTWEDSDYPEYPADWNVEMGPSIPNQWWKE